MHRKLNQLLLSAHKRLWPKTYGSACSGTDILFKILQVLDEKWFDLDLQMRFDWSAEFATENKVDKASFLKSQHPLKKLFGDVDCLTQDRAKNELTNETVVVPYVSMFSSGFVCTSRASTNNKRAAFAHCLQDEQECETQRTWAATYHYVKEFRPTIVLLENVKELLQESATGLSDIGYVVKQLEALQYCVHAHVMEACEYGSLARRKRVYILAVQLLESMKPVKEDLLKFCENFLESIQIESGKPQEFLDLGAPTTMSLTMSQQGPSPDPVAEVNERQAKSRKVDRDGKFRDEHLAIYRHLKMKWPPVLADHSNIDFTNMTERQCELAVLMDKGWPCKETVAVPEFCDINNSFSRLLGVGGSKSEFNVDQLDPASYPWKQQVPTMTSLSAILMRWSPEGVASHVLRLLTGKEMMALAGWSKTMWSASMQHEVEDSVYVSLAGNAFSAFAAAPMVILGLAMSGDQPDLFVPFGPTEDAIAIADSQFDCDSSASSPL